MNDGKNLRVLVLFEVHEPAEPDASYEKYMAEDPQWQTEGHVVAALRANGHEVHFGAIYQNPREVIDLVERVRPDLVWNSVEAFHDHRYYEANVVALLELLKVPYTGSDSRSLMLCQDKALSKKILKHHRVGVPPFVVSPRNQPVKRIPKVMFPVLVKPLAEEGSVGIARDSFCENDEKALKRAAFLHERYKQDVIFEQYIEGTELYAGVLGDGRLQVLPPRELKFANVPEGEPKVASFKAKWDDEYRERWGIHSTFPETLPEKVARDIDSVARRTFRALRLRGYARVDLRLTSEGKLFVVEANPNPQIARSEDFAEAAEKAGISYEQLIERIVRLGLRMSFP
jgi:D-alanine-D-alanine ligase